MEIALDVAEAKASGRPFRVENDLALGATRAIYLSDGEIEAARQRTAAEKEEQRRTGALARLAEIDAQSVRGLREWIAARPDAPQALKDQEAAAVAARAELSR